MIKNIETVILTAGEPRFANETYADNVNLIGKIALDWIIDALNLPNDRILIIGGYEINRIKLNFQEFNIKENKSWRIQGSAGSLLYSIPYISNKCLFVYGDIIFRKHLLAKIRNSKSDVVIIYDSKINVSSEKNKKLPEEVVLSNKAVTAVGTELKLFSSKSEFVGLIQLSGKVIKYLKNLDSNESKRLSRYKVSDLIDYLRACNFNIDGIDAQGDWAEIDYVNDVAKFILGSKSETLERLETKLKKSNILPQINFTILEWLEKKNDIISNVKNTFFDYKTERKVIVRSSSIFEDTFEISGAGRFESILNVTKLGLSKSINLVAQSFGQEHTDVNKILVQPMLENVKMSGVCFTRTNEFGAPWYVINFEYGTLTDGITSGNSNNHKTLYVSRFKNDYKTDNIDINNLLDAIKEIENLLGYEYLDIEFGITKSGKVYIFQVRPLIVNKNLSNIADSDFEKSLEKCENYLNSYNIPTLHFDRKVPIAYGVMPDWNPIEIIGSSPSRLSYSLYNQLIMIDNWARQRKEYGFKSMLGTPLMVDIMGTPMVDVRASMCSFIPNEFPPESTEKLLTYYIKKLKKNPHFHDKIEFEIVHTCLTLDFKNDALDLLTQNILNRKEIECLELELCKITNKAIDRVDNDLMQLEKLNDYLISIDKLENLDPLQKAQSLLSYCKEYGTLPFAHAARTGFVAVSFLKSGLNSGLYNIDKYNEFFASLKTISKEFSEDTIILNQGNMAWEDYSKKYGHLRPGTYDITSPQYKSQKELFIKESSIEIKSNKSSAASGSIFEKESNLLAEKLSDIGIKISNGNMINFLKTAIEGREKSKFIFSRVLSEVLECLAVYGKEIGLTREDLSNLEFETIVNLSNYGSDNDALDIFNKIISINKRNKLIAASSKVPPLIFDPKDIYSFEIGVELPNYIGSDNIIAEIVEIKNQPSDDILLLMKNKIVIIEQADPGYDWIFNAGIIGLVTKYGGANSHMAIRAAEFNLTAAIGVGDIIYKDLKLANTISINPLDNKMSIIN